MDDVPYEITEIIISYLNLEELENFIEHIKSFLDIEKLNWKVIFKYAWESSNYYNEWNENINNYADYYNYIVSHHLFETDLYGYTINEIAYENNFYVDININTISSTFGKLRNLSLLRIRADYGEVSNDIINQNLNIISKFNNIEILELFFKNLMLDTSHLEQLKYLRRLNRLHITWHNLSKIPDEIFLLDNISHLSLTESIIEEIPEEIKQMKNLSSLSLNSNKIKDFSNVCKLTSLRLLHLFVNNVQTIPLEIIKLTNLTSLNLAANEIDEIPEALITHLNNLTYINLHDNKINDPRVELLRDDNYYYCKYESLGDMEAFQKIYQRKFNNSL